MALLLLCISLLPVFSMPTEPRNKEDAARLRNRSGFGLPVGRKVLAKTSSAKDKFSAAFSQWLQEMTGKDLSEHLSCKPFDAEAVVDFLVNYGRDLYGSGRPYHHFSETVNAVTSLKPILRRQCQAAWDLAFAWQAEEPYNHHTALPAQVLLAVLTVCLLWGWVREAGIFALAWGGLLRIGEATNAKRSDLVLPSDTLFTQTYVLLKIKEPKTRVKAARHQASKVERVDLVRVITMAFFDCVPDEKLWPLSTQTLRRRFECILERLKVPERVGTNRPLDLGSFRPGGATFLLESTEDSELVRRRGRWASHRVMEIYIQEISSSTFIADLPLDSRRSILDAAQWFTTSLDKAELWTRASIPRRMWFFPWTTT